MDFNFVHYNPLMFDCIVLQIELNWMNEIIL